MLASGPADLFSGHLLQPRGYSNIPRTVVFEIWPSVFLVACLIMLAVIKGAGAGRLLRVIQSTFSKQILQQIDRDEGATRQGYSLLLDIFFLLNLSFFVYKVNEVFPIVLRREDSLLQFVFFLVLVTAVYLVRKLIDTLLAFFTGEEKLVSDYAGSATLLNQTFGVFVFPFLVLSEFTDLPPQAFLYSAGVILAFSLLVKWYRGMMMGLVERRLGILQIFSYFCGLEILPLFVVGKFVIETF